MDTRGQRSKLACGRRKARPLHRHGAGRRCAGPREGSSRGCSATPTPTRSGCPTRAQILYGILNERSRRPRRAHLRPLGRHGGCDARGSSPALLAREPRGCCGLRPCSRSTSRLSSSTRTWSIWWTSPAPHPRCERDERFPLVVAGGHAPSTPSRWPTSSTLRSRRWRRGGGEINDVLAAHPPAHRPPSGPRGRSPRSPGSTSEPGTRRATRAAGSPARALSAGSPTWSRSAHLGPGEWPYPRRQLVPVTEVVQTGSTRGLPGLHARLSLLPGGDDHPPVRERPAPGARHGAARASSGAGYDEVTLTSLSTA